MSNFENKKQKRTKVLAGFLMSFLVVGLAIIVLIFIQKNYEKGEARGYLKKEAREFSNVIELINKLSTNERWLGAESESDDIVLSFKVMEREVDDSGKILEKITEINKKREGASLSNYFTYEVDLYLGDFYKGLEKNIKDYHDFHNYDLQRLKKINELEDFLEDVENVEGITKEERNKNLKKNIKEKDAKEKMKKIISEIKAISPPEFLEDLSKKEKDSFDEYEKLYISFFESVEKGDEDEIKKANKELEQFMKSDREFTERLGEDMSFHFDGIHEGFSLLEDKASRIKNEFSHKKTELRVEIFATEIENW